MAASGLIAAALGCWTGCVLDSASDGKSAGPEATGSESATTTLKTRSPEPVNGVPMGCTREWSSTAHDSVIFCPDLRPPKP
ncbi:MAG: hypothetical protein ABIW76_19620 [Fibrobacteria bacterium]